LVRAAAIAAVPSAPSVAVAGLAGFAFPGGFVMAGADSGPGGEVGGGAEPAHITTGLGDDHLSGGLADPGNGLKPLKLAGERAHPLLDPLG
jgi:hypothetical protein